MIRKTGRRLSPLFLAAILCASVARAQTPPSAPATAPQSPAQAQSAQPQAPQVQTGPIDRPGAFLLMRNALLALDHANKANDYSIFRTLSSAAFQINSAAKLSDIFEGQRREGLNLAYAAIMEPRWTVEPQIEASGMIHMAGYFEVNPVPVAFDLLFTQQNGQWLLFGVSVGLAPPASQAAAPTTPTPAAPAGAKAAETKPTAKPATPAATPAPKPATPAPRQP